tara:strand:- start:780 stop:1001 length:222 start_codon:yes stop_codon:yes gene_type:complete
MSFRDNNKVDYDYWKSLSDEDWSTNTTGGRNKPIINSLDEKLIELTKIVESLQDRIEVLESIESKEWDETRDC